MRSRSRSCAAFLTTICSASSSSERPHTARPCALEGTRRPRAQPGVAGGPARHRHAPPEEVHACSRRAPCPAPVARRRRGRSAVESARTSPGLVGERFGRSRENWTVHFAGACAVGDLVRVRVERAGLGRAGRSRGRGDRRHRRTAAASAAHAPRGGERVSGCSARRPGGTAQRGQIDAVQPHRGPPARIVEDTPGVTRDPAVRGGRPRRPPLPRGGYRRVHAAGGGAAGPRGPRAGRRGHSRGRRAGAGRGRRAGIAGADRELASLLRKGGKPCCSRPTRSIPPGAPKR